MFLLTRQMKFNWFPASRIATVASLFADASRLATTRVMATRAMEVVIQQVADWTSVTVDCVTEF
jgi:hypothetical protein